VGGSRPWSAPDGGRDLTGCWEPDSQIAITGAAVHPLHAAALVGREAAKLRAGPLLGGFEVVRELRRATRQRRVRVGEPLGDGLLARLRLQAGESFEDISHHREHGAILRNAPDESPKDEDRRGGRSSIPGSCALDQVRRRGSTVSAVAAGNPPNPRGEILASSGSVGPVAPDTTSAFITTFTTVTQRVTKRARKRRKCGWCREWFKPQPKGRPPSYCSASCRQRAFEQRREQRRRTDPLRAALDSDLAETMERTKLRKRVIRMIEVLGLDPEQISDDKLYELIEIERLEDQTALPPARERRAKR
jgi:hypothetical protein